MSPRWQQPTTFGLAEKLKKVNTRLREILPLLIEAQGEAVKRMAETAIAVQPKREEGRHEQ